jgi:hypothetical protein
MAYKFQLGAATLSGSTTFEESLTTQGVLEGSQLISKSTISGSGALQGASVSVEGAASVGSLDANSGGITNAGAIAGATSIDGSGDLTMGTITMTGFAVDADGDTALKSLAVDDGSTIGTDSDTDMLTLTNASDITVASDLDFNIDKAGGLQLNGTAVTSTAAELNLLDTAAAGTVVNSKAVIYGGAGQVNGTTVSSSAGLAGASVSVDGAVTGGSLVSTSTVSGSGALQGASVAVDGNISAGQLSSSANLLVGGTVQLDGVAEISAFARGEDSLFFRDGTDNLMKATNMADFFGEIGGNGLTENDNRLIVDVSGAMTIDSGKLGITGSIAGNGITFAGGANSISSLSIDLATDSGLNSGAGAGGDQLVLSFADLGNETVAVADDFIAFMDSGSANQPTKRVTIADFVSGIAGAGLSAASGQLSTAGNSVALKADGDTLATGVNYFASASANATVSLPGSPTVGDRVVAKAAELGDGSKVIIQRQGSHVIDDDQTQIEIESPFGAVTLVYVVANEWRII